MTNASVYTAPARPTLRATLGGLRRVNAGVGVLHLVQGIAILLLASAFSLPVSVLLGTDGLDNHQPPRRPG